MLGRLARSSRRSLSHLARGSWGAAGSLRSLSAAAAATMGPVDITVARGDGIGPEIMDATLRILEASKAQIVPHEIEIGEQVYKSGYTSGIKPEAWDLLRSTKVFLKAPITTPTGGGYKSLNVSVRKTLGLFANVRPVQSMHPFVHCDKHPIDMVIIRENEEDLYAGIEHQQTPDVTQCLKIITRQGCERIARYAFDFARRNNRKRVTCMVKDNIMKMTDGLFYNVFENIGKTEYPDIARDRMIIDIGSAIVADDPGRFDVILTTNLYGDIISDVAVQVAGSVGLGGSANVGDQCAMFEAVHGSAPDIAGKNIANPSGLLLGAVQMLQHIRQPAAAEQIYNAWLRTIEDGCHTVDIYNPDNEAVGSEHKMGTKEFADAVIERLGQEPVNMKPVKYTGKAQAAAMGQGHGSSAGEGEGTSESPRWDPPRAVKTLHGVDAFVQWEGRDPDSLASRVQAAVEKAGVKDLELRLITNRGVRCWPEHFPETFLVDHWRCRFRATGEDAGEVPMSSVLKVLGAVAESGDGVDLIKMEGLYLFDGQLGFSLGQGE